MLTLAGVVGLGPGAALGQTPPPSHPVTTASSGSGGQSGDTTTTGNGAGASRGSSSDGWLTIDDSPAVDPTKPARDRTTRSTALPADSGSGKRVVYAIGAQRVWLVGSSGKVQRTYLVSGGRNAALLKPGTYQVTSMSRHAIAYNHKSTMNYMVRFATGRHAPIGFHDVPARDDGSLVQSRSELGTPLSSGCIRQWISDAKAMWQFVSVDTAVVVTT